MPNTSPAHSWGVTWLLRAAFLALAGVFAVQAVVPWSDTSNYLEGWPTRALGLAVAGAFVVVAFRPRITLAGDSIVARGVVFAKTIPLSELADVRVGYYGLTLSTRDGHSFTTTFVGEKSNVARLLGRRSDADDVARALLCAAREGRDSHAEGID